MSPHTRIHCEVRTTLVGSVGVKVSGQTVVQVGLALSKTEYTKWHSRAIHQIPTSDGSEPSTDGDVADRFYERLAQYLHGGRQIIDVPWSLAAQSPFARDVLDALGEVAYGTTVSYGELARRAGHPKAARAVGGALNRNPLPLLIPCHRVISTDGSIGGFGSGLDCKRALHEIEGIGPLTLPAALAR